MSGLGRIRLLSMFPPHNWQRVATEIKLPHAGESKRKEPVEKLGWGSPEPKIEHHPSSGKARLTLETAGKETHSALIAAVGEFFNRLGRLWGQAAAVTIFT